MARCTSNGADLHGHAFFLYVARLPAVSLCMLGGLTLIGAFFGVIVLLCAVDLWEGTPWLRAVVGLLVSMANVALVIEALRRDARPCQAGHHDEVSRPFIGAMARMAGNRP